MPFNANDNFADEKVERTVKRPKPVQYEELMGDDED